MIKIPDSRNFDIAFRHLLCEERKKRGETQFELAKKSGLTRQCISLLESGRRIPTFFSLFHLAKGFDMPLSKFMGLLINKVEYYECREKLLLAADSKKTRWRR
ncbi:MAG: helix-turn-helix domain-containing protein [Fibromonadales bacterium]|nr:helix-turn-helix domain-containing protein [Fibromonadales bacterium]